MTHAIILGCRVDAVDTAQAVDRIRELLRVGSPSLVVTLGTEMIVRAQHDERFRAIVNASALSLCDTVGVMFAARVRRARIRERVAGVDLVDPLCRALARDGTPVYLLGSKGDTAERAAGVLRARHPGLIVAGFHDGYFAPSDDAAVAAAVARSGARVLLAGLGSPRQELWLAEHLKETDCAVGIGIGGSLDVLAGNVRRAPVLWQRAHVEWLYRLVREPRRWRRQLALPRFVWLVLRDQALLALPRRS
ncbi:MAG: WecB/TagA/CpsF family glycosyltransferase [Candidatus Eremiobacteraeota bacterium]|nr:WecB/TagA/CpsF family glycosyltransferase [Candidatus Eremiobacteraeota bacterium]MBC5803232.1 WecB/TagA/CpsF family glycosyltransferase [Candidatus Eremiobacteraeota bacterium]MBC5823040.1 WecB/TagA/CpsF family glycosyltransferase [Candidatus Eremiobacteraeota bacterium]